MRMFHNLRQSLLFNDQPERTSHLIRFSDANILKRLARLPNFIMGKHPERGGARKGVVMKQKKKNVELDEMKYII